MKTDINSPAQSKINLTAGVTAVMNVGVYYASDWGWIPQAALPDVLVVGNMAAFGLIGVWRTWHTKP